MSRFNVQTNNMQSRAGNVGFSLGSLTNSGLLPKELMGLGYNSGGNSSFASVAHIAEQAKRLNNINNNSASDQIGWKVDVGGEKVTTPFEFNGKVYRPSSDGRVRITDSGKVALATKIKAFQEKEVDDLMDIAMVSDEMCQYIFGLTPAEWKSYTDEINAPQIGTNDKGIINIDPSLAKLKCSIEYIESLPPSLTQTQSIAKLRKIVKHFATSVNLEGLSDLADMARNIKDGHNNPFGDGRNALPAVANGAENAMRALPAE